MLKTINQMLIWLCAYPFPDTATKEEKMKLIAYASTMFLALIFQLICYLLYFWKFVSIDIIGSLFALMGSTAIGGLIYISVTAFRLKFKMKTIFENLSMIYGTSKLNCCSTLNMQFIIIFKLLSYQA